MKKGKKVMAKKRTVFKVKVHKSVSKAKAHRSISKGNHKKSGQHKTHANLSLKKKKVISLKENAVLGGRVSSGVENFDSLVGGGFEKNSTNLLLGASGSGKTIFAMQFLIGGLIRGEKCLYITFEETKTQFFANMKEFGWDLEEYEKKGLFTFLEYTPSKVRIMLEEGGGTIESVVIGKKISRMVIDSISSFELLFKDELEKREASLSLFSMLRGWDCTTLLTLDRDPLEKGSGSAIMLEFEVDSIVSIYYVMQNGKRERFVEVLKMRGTEHSNKIHALSLGKKGFTVGKKPVKKNFA